LSPFAPLRHTDMMKLDSHFLQLCKHT